MARLHFFVGKGGVGKTTASLAFASSLALNGKKVLFVELSEQSAFPHLFELPALTYKPHRLFAHLSGAKITGTESLKEYLMRQLRVERLYRLFFDNRPVRYFFDVAPAIRDLMILGKLFFELDKGTLDAIVVDAPSTGHAQMLLSTPKVVMTLTKFGPIFEKARRIGEGLLSKETVFHLICLPRPIVLTETLELSNSLIGSGLHLETLCVNRVLPRIEASPNSPEFLLTLQARTQAEHRELARLKRLSRVPVRSLPEFTQIMSVKSLGEWASKEWDG